MILSKLGVRGGLSLRTPFGMGVLFCVVVGLFLIARSLMWTYGADTGIFMQATASVLHGYLDGPEAGTHFRYHWSPILAVLSPIVWLWHSNLAIQIPQMLVIAATAFPLYALARRYTDEKTAFHASLWAFLYAPLFSIACEEFHELAFYPVLALALIETADRRAWLQFALVAFASVLVREDALLVNVAAGAMLIAIGLGYLRPIIGAAMHGKRDVAMAGAALIVVSFVVMFGYFHVLIPAIGAWSPTHFYSYDFANGPGELIIALIKNPLLIGHFLTIGRATYLLEAFVPLLFLPFRSKWMLLSMPGFAVILLSNSGVVWRMGDQYAALWIPWALLAAFDGLLQVRAAHGEAIVQRFERGVTAVMIVVIFAFNPVHPFHYLQASPDHAQARAALALVPRDAYLLTHDEWYSATALDHPNATVYLDGHYDWVVLDRAYNNRAVQTIWRPFMEAKVRSGEMKAVAHFDDVVVYRRN